MPTISTGSTVLFSHPAARLVKAIPPLQPPPRINAAVPLDSIGMGNLAPTDYVLVDAYGLLQISVIVDPVHSDIATLAISVGFDDRQLGTASRRFVLPFRNYPTHDIDNIKSLNQTQQFNPRKPNLYQGLGAGATGQDGGSFWFFEDLSEQGATDRKRWQDHGVGKRAIWTLWLFSTPAPVIDYARNLLAKYPQPIPELPPFLVSPDAFPWRDNYFSVPSTSKVLAPFHQTDSFQVSRVNATQEADKPLPPIPYKPERLRSIPLPSCPSTNQQLAVSESSSTRLEQQTSALLSQISSSHDNPTDATMLEIQPASSVFLRDPSKRQPITNYRNSLVAVDNETGQIISILASNIELQGIVAPPSPSKEPTVSLDTIILNADLQSEQVTLIPSIVSCLARDTGHKRLPSRTESILGDDTFAPPPLPPKSHHDGMPAKTSGTSSLFFSAVEYQENHQKKDERERKQVKNEMMNHLVSIDHGNFEPHRPELLRDQKKKKEREQVDDYDEAESDASGSTIGGPVVRLWRKARGKYKNKKRNSVVKPSQYVVGEDGEEEGKKKKETERIEELVSTTAITKTIASQTTNHPTRSRLRTDEIQTIEDRVWQEALDSNELPLDAAYTHLVARRTNQKEEKETKDDSKEFKLEVSDNVTRYSMQGGTVLIEFLAGSSKIGASLLRFSSQEDESFRSSTVTTESSLSGYGSVIFSVIPLLPQHLFSFLGITTTSLSTTTTSTSTSSMTMFSSLTNLFSDATDWVGNLFFSPSSPSSSTLSLSSNSTSETSSHSKVEQSECAIPNFNSNSPTSSFNQTNPIHSKTITLACTRIQP